MSGRPHERPPRLAWWLARLLIRGADSAFVRADLDASHERDLERGLGAGPARRRYLRNVVGSIGSVWYGGVVGILTHGIGVDARLGFRMLFRQPVLTGVAMLALGLGIPSALGMRHALDAMLSPLPIPEGERVVGLRHWDLSQGPRMTAIHDFVRWRETLTSYEVLGAARSSPIKVGEDAGAPPVQSARISASSFDLLRIAPLMGRVLGEADEIRGAPAVALLREDLWASRFAGDPEIIGKTIRVGREVHTVVGVMPSEFRFPMDNDLWLPVRTSPVDHAVGEGPGFWVFGRLAEGVTADEADQEVQRMTDRARLEEPQRMEHFVGQAVEMPLLFMREQRSFRNNPEMLLAEALIFMLLLIVCGNVGLLVLARTAARMGELSIRTALGASRGRIIAQLFVESLVLAVVATGSGLLAAEVLTRWLTEVLAPMGFIPYWVDITMTPRTVLLALALAIGSAVVAGVVPAFQATRRGVHANLQRTAAGTSSIRFGWGSSVLIVTEVVLAVGFLAMGGALVRTAFQDSEGSLGFEPERYLSASLGLPRLLSGEETGLDADGVTRRTARSRTDFLSSLAEAEGVLGVGLSTGWPSSSQRRVVLETGGLDTDEAEFTVRAVSVEVGFFRGLDRPILAGRDFTNADVEGSPDVHRPEVIVNTSFVEHVLGGRSAIGQRFRYTPRYGFDPDAPEWFEIVGVVGRFGLNPLNPVRDAGVYLPLKAGQVEPARYIVEVAGAPADFASTVRALAANVDPEAMALVRPLTNVLEGEAKVFRWAYSMQMILASVAFLLAVTGLYALMSFTVSQRTREIGIRTALGARAWSIVSTVARRAAVQLGLGLLLGSLWAWVLLLEIQNDSMIAPFNLLFTIGVTIVLAGLVGVAACAVPTIRGLRIEPTEALREN